MFEDLIIMIRNQKLIVAHESEKIFLLHDDWKEFEDEQEDVPQAPDSIKTEEADQNAIIEQEIRHKNENGYDSDETLVNEDLTENYTIPDDMKASLESNLSLLVEISGPNENQNVPLVALPEKVKSKPKRKPLKEISKAREGQLTNRNNTERKAHLKALVDKSRKDDGTFLCILCKKKICKNDNGLKIHISKVHCKGNDIVSLDNLDPSQATPKKDISKTKKSKSPKKVNGVQIPSVTVKQEIKETPTPGSPIMTAQQQFSIDKLVNKSKVPSKNKVFWVCFVCKKEFNDQQKITDHCKRDHMDLVNKYLKTCRQRRMST